MEKQSKIQELLQSAWIKRREGDYATARQLVDEARVKRDQGDHASLGRIYHLYMQFESDQDNFTEALGWCQKSLIAYEQFGNQLRIAHATRHLADLERNLGMQNEAEHHYREAIAIYRQHAETSPTTLANALRGYALLLENCGKTEEAVAIWQETRGLYADSNIPAGVAEADERLAGLAGV